MSATNSTPIINLPLFIGTDKPAWLVDWNNAMNIIDSNISALQSAEGGTAASLAALSQSVQALSGTVDQHTTALQTATQAIAGNTGSINTINSLIGNGQPTTTDKTIIGAINELHSDQGDLANLTTPAASLVAAINNIAAGGAVAASAVSYDNTASGMTADDVQEAIDELKTDIDNLPSANIEQALVTGTTYNGASGDTTINYPTGYTKDNCMIVAAYIELSNHNVFVTADSIGIGLYESNITVSLISAGSGYQNQPIKILLQKLPA